jgi:hypothetical protein
MEEMVSYRGQRNTEARIEEKANSDLAVASRFVGERGKMGR